MCLAYVYAKDPKKSWRGKQNYNHELKIITEYGESISVDQNQSPTPGLISQMTGRFTTKRYKYATVFVDQASKLSYAYLQKTNSVDKNLEEKKGHFGNTALIRVY